jgi:hypothetical protein
VRSWGSAASLVCPAAQWRKEELGRILPGDGREGVWLGLDAEGPRAVSSQTRLLTVLAGWHITESGSSRIVA